MSKSEFRPLIKLPFLTIHYGDIPVVAVSFMAGYLVAKWIETKI